MNKYELALVVNAKIDDEARTAVVDKAKDYITRAGGQIGEIDDRGIQKMDEGYYYFIPFDSDPEAPAKIEADVRIMENVLRFLIVRTDEK